MKILKKRFLLSTVLVVGILMVGVLTTSASAQDAIHSSIVERLATRFNLNKDEVQEVFAEFADEHKADMFAHWAERLDDLVAEGKLTEEQKQLILDKHEEFENKIEELHNQDLTMEERKTKMREFHEEIRKWAEENDLNEIPLFFGGKGMGFHMVHKAGPGNDEHVFKGEFFTKKLD